MNRRASILALAFGLALAAQHAETYGATAVSYVRVSAFEFFPLASSLGYDTEANSWARQSTGGDGWLFAPLSLPSGARVVSVKFEFIDYSDDALDALLLTCTALTELCISHPLAGAGPADCRTAGRICSGQNFEDGPGSVTADLTPDDITIDNLGHSYVLKIQPPEPGLSLRVAGIVVGYVLQVSPPPAAATFNDVPTGHPFFQFVEALAKSGITGGCSASPPRYCPDAPLTRGQMAVFLAKALGLQWP